MSDALIVEFDGKVRSTVEEFTPSFTGNSSTRFFDGSGCQFLLTSIVDMQIVFFNNIIQCPSICGMPFSQKSMPQLKSHDEIPESIPYILEANEESPKYFILQEKNFPCPGLDYVGFPYSK